MATLTARVPEELVNDIERVSMEEQLDKSTVVRRLLSASIQNWREEKAVELYQKNLISAGQAAKFAKTSLWRFFEVLKEKHVEISYDEEELEEDLKAIGWKR